MADQSGIMLKELRVDGGVSVVDNLLQMQADQVGMTVTRPRNVETTAVGVALMAALGAGVFTRLDDMITAWQMDVTMQPEQDRSAADMAYQGWIRALEKSRGWVVYAG